MKWRFQWAYWAGLSVLLVMAFWSVWASAQEVTNVPATAVATNRLQQALVKLNEHTLTFGLDHVALLRDNAFLDQPLWKYLASLIYIALAFAVAWLVDFIISAWLKRWVAKTETKHDDMFLELLRGPVKVVFFVIFLNVGLNIFEWPERAQLFLSHGFIVVDRKSVV